MKRAKYSHGRPLPTAAIAVAAFMAALVEGDVSLTQLSETSGLHPSTVSHYVRAMRKIRVVHVSDWRPDRRGRMTIAGFSLGSKPDLAKPTLTQQQRQAIYRARRRQAKLFGLTTPRITPTTNNKESTHVLCP